MKGSRTWAPDAETFELEALLKAALLSPQYVVSKVGTFEVRLIQEDARKSLEELFSRPGPLKPGDFDG